jgi:uncharacterized damage-inducible protein DinB
MPTPDDMILLARYNAGMNHKLYTAAASLPHAGLVVDRGAFFCSLLGTLNHLVAGDTIWLMRFALHPAGFAALAPLRNAPIPSNLVQRYGDTLDELLAHRKRLDAIISELAAQLRQTDLDLPLAYRNSRGVEYRKHFGSLLLHFFNHQTHHRGQASTLLSQAGVDIGVTDLLELVGDAE